MADHWERTGGKAVHNVSYGDEESAEGAMSGVRWLRAMRGDGERIKTQRFAEEGKEAVVGARAVAGIQPLLGAIQSHLLWGCILYFSSHLDHHKRYPKNPYTQS